MPGWWTSPAWDVILVGDSVALVLAGEATTIPATVDQMIYHGCSVRRGRAGGRRPSFLSYQVVDPEGSKTPPAGSSRRPARPR
ncbi:MAG: 3-methyl-2-oxobutanoate hydroxymethyltransferase [Gemmatimonadales bacterium]